MLAFKPIPHYDEEKEYTISAVAHSRFFNETLEMYGKSIKNVSFLSGDSCKTNLKIANDNGLPLIGCYSHRFNLAVKQYISKSGLDEAIKKIHKIMVELETIKKSAGLRLKTDLVAKKSNSTRWSSTYEMVERYFLLFPFLDEKDEELKALSLNSKEFKELEILFKNLQGFNSITIALQNDNMDLLKARSLFDGLVDIYPSMDYYLASNAKIVHSPMFECAVVNYLKGSELSIEHIKVLSDFKTDCIDVDSGDVPEHTNLASQILARKKIKKTDTYNVAMIPPTSNHVERFFSKAPHILSDTRKCMLPRTLELILFLKVNSDFWNLRIFGELKHQ